MQDGTNDADLNLAGVEAATVPTIDFAVTPVETKSGSDKLFRIDMGVPGDIPSCACAFFDHVQRLVTANGEALTFMVGDVVTGVLHCNQVVPILSVGMDKICLATYFLQAEGFSTAFEDIKSDIASVMELEETCDQVAQLVASIERVIAGKAITDALALSEAAEDVDAETTGDEATDGEDEDEGGPPLFSNKDPDWWKKGLVDEETKT